MKDLLGKDPTEGEQAVLDTYHALKDLAAREDLPPCAARAARTALAQIWNAAVDLDLVFEQTYDLGV